MRGSSIPRSREGGWDTALMVRGFLLVVAVLTLTSTAQAASAEQDYTRTPPVVQGVEISRPAAAPAAPAVLAQEADPDDDRIPITGGDVAGLVLVGIGSVAAGAALRRRASRHA